MSELADMALHGRGDMEYVQLLSRQAEIAHTDDLSEIQTQKGPVTVVSSVRVMDRGDGEVIGFSYGCPPMDWILRWARVPSFGIAKKVAGTLNELQMVAVLPRHRGNGLGGRLMADAEERYRKAGYRAVLVTVENKPSSLINWYAKQGYMFSQQEEPVSVRYWPNRQLSSLYGCVTTTQRVGFKALAEGVTVGDARVDGPRWERKQVWRNMAAGTTASGMFPVEGSRCVQRMVEVSGLLG